ncbi:MAG: dockerin type I domain-containing protein [Candidatus Zixiibacteriota bacterium]
MNKTIKGAFISVFVILMTFSSSFGATNEVPNGYANIQSAIDASFDGDTVLVHDGTYLGNGNRDIAFGGRLIVLMSENGPDVTKLAVQGTESDRHRAFSFTSGEDSTAVVKGFRIEGGTYNIGGAVLVENSSPKFENCAFYNNNNIPVEDIAYGGAIALSYSSSIIRNCLFANNRSAAGASIYAFNGEPIIESCTFRDNYAQPAVTDAYAAGIYMLESDAIIRHCLFFSNSALKGTALTIETSSPFVEHCTFTRNGGSAQGSVVECIGGGISTMPYFTNCIIAYNDQCKAVACDDFGGLVNPELVCCDLYGNTLGSWVGCIESFAEENGNLYVNPLFCNIAARDFHIARNSQCAAANNLCSDLIGALDVRCGGIGTEIAPCIMYVYYAYALEPEYADIYIYTPVSGYTLYDIDTSSILVNYAFHPFAFEYIEESDSTQAALKMTVSQTQFIQYYMPLWDVDMLQYNLYMSYDKGNIEPPAMSGWFNLIGHRSGDVNIDGSINLLDITYLVRYLYKDGPEPVPKALAAEIDGSGNVNILDVAYLVNYLFKNGPPPVELSDR